MVKSIKEFVHNLPRDIYKMFVWEAKPGKKYPNPYLGFTIGIVGMILFATSGSRRMSFFMGLFALLSLVYGDYIKGGWLGFKRKMEGKK